MGSDHSRNEVIQIAYESQEVEGILGLIGFDVSRFKEIVGASNDPLMRTTVTLIRDLDVTEVQIRITPDDYKVVELSLRFGSNEVILFETNGHFYIRRGPSTHLMTSINLVEFTRSFFKSMQSSVQTILASCSPEAS